MADPKETKADMRDEIESMQAQINNLLAQVARLTAALSNSVGGDEAVAHAMAPKTYQLVQFTAELNSAGRCLTPNGRKQFVLPYHATSGQIVKLPTFEVEKLKAERPDLLITDPAKFLPMKRREYITDKKTGTSKWEWVEYPAAEVAKEAREIG